MLDVQKYKSSLLEFLRLIEGLDQPRSVVAEHLRFPAFEFSTLAGSSFGRDVWQHPTAQELIDVLLEDEDLNRWFGAWLGPSPESRLNEMRAHIATFVAAWGLYDHSPDQIVAEWADSLLLGMKNPEPACSRVRVLYGVEVEHRIDLPGGLAVEQASAERLRDWLGDAHAFERDALRIPRGPAILLTGSARVHREHFGCFAATAANGGAEVLVEHARWNIWLATGVLPRLGDSYVIEHAQFPVTPYERYPASYRETHAHAMDREPAMVDEGLLVQVHKRMAVLQGEHETFPEEAMMPLWVANAFTHTAVEAADDLVTVLLAHSATEGLLLGREDNKSRLVPRLAHLIQRDHDEGRRIRRAVKRWTEIRDFAAHGQRPPDRVLGPFIEREASQEDSSPFLSGDAEAWITARRRASKLFRRVFLAMLFCMVGIENEASPQPQLARDEILEILERAASGDDAARREIADRVPEFVRDIGL